MLNWSEIDACRDAGYGGERWEKPTRFGTIHEKFWKSSEARSIKSNPELEQKERATGAGIPWATEAFLTRGKLSAKGEGEQVTDAGLS